jgi:hypothetical protein
MKHWAGWLWASFILVWFALGYVLPRLQPALSGLNA